MENTINARVQLLAEVFHISAGDVAKNSNHSISRASAYRLLSGKKLGSPAMRQAVTVGIIETIRRRCDSGYLWRIGTES